MCKLYEADSFSYIATVRGETNTEGTNNLIPDCNADPYENLCSIFFIYIFTILISKINIYCLITDNFVL